MQYGAPVNPSMEYPNANSHNSPSVSSPYGGFHDPRVYNFGTQIPMNPNGFSHATQLQHNGGAFTTQANPLMYTQAMYAMNPSLASTMYQQNSGLFNNPPSASTAVPQATTQPESQPSRPPKNDEDALVNALIVGRNSGLSDRQAIQRLHMTNGHTSDEWLDYLLLHHAPIDAEVSKYAGPAVGPQFTKMKAPISPSGTASVNPPTPQASTSAPVKAERRPSNKHPDPPSAVRSPKLEEPVPPVATGRNRRPLPYTEADDVYMVAYYAWELHRNPSQTRYVICQRMAPKVPHHSFASWKSHVDNCEEVDTLFQQAWQREQKAHQHDEEAASGESAQEYDDDEGDEDFEDPGDSEDSEFEEIQRTGRKRKNIFDWMMKNEGSDLESSEDEGPIDVKPGRTFTGAEHRCIAKRMSKFTHDSWIRKNKLDRWRPLRKNLPGRTLRSLKSHYQKHRNEYDDLAERYRQRRKQRETRRRQRHQR